MTSGLKVTDTHNGLRVFTQETGGRLELTMDRMAHGSQFLDKIRELNLKWMEYPVQIKYTKYSLKKGQTNSAIFKILLDLFFGRFMK